MADREHPAETNQALSMAIMLLMDRLGITEFRCSWAEMRAIMEQERAIAILAGADGLEIILPEGTLPVDGILAEIRRMRLFE